MAGFACLSLILSGYGFYGAVQEKNISWTLFTGVGVILSITLFVL